MKNQTRVFVSLLTLPIAGLLGAAALLLRGPVGLPQVDPQAWANVVTSGSYPIAQALYIVAYVLPYAGFWALYACLSVDKRGERLGFYGFMAAIMGTSFALPTLGAFTYAGPPVGALYLAGNTDLLQIITNSLTGLPLWINLLGGILYLLGAVLLGIAIWFNPTFPKGAGVLLALSGLLLVFGFAMYPVLLLSWFLFIISGAWLTWTWRQA